MLALTVPEGHDCKTITAKEIDRHPGWRPVAIYEEEVVSRYREGATSTVDKTTVTLMLIVRPSKQVAIDADSRVMAAEKAQRDAEAESATLRTEVDTHKVAIANYKSAIKATEDRLAKEFVILRKECDQWRVQASKDEALRAALCAVGDLRMKQLVERQAAAL